MTSFLNSHHNRFNHPGHERANGLTSIYNQNPAKPNISDDRALTAYPAPPVTSPDYFFLFFTRCMKTRKRTKTRAPMTRTSGPAPPTETPGFEPWANAGEISISIVLTPVRYSLDITVTAKQDQADPHRRRATDPTHHLGYIALAGKDYNAARFNVRE